MKIKSLALSTIIVLIVSIFFIFFLEGIFSYIYSSKYFKQKKEFESFQKNILLKNQKFSIDPYNQKKKSKGRTLSNRYTDAVSGRYAPNTLATKYSYNHFVKGKGEGLFTDNYGFIHNGNPERKLFQKDFHNIILSGGSTAEGANTTSSNENTIAANLEKKLRKNISKVNVINAAKSGYNSFDEFITLYNLLGQYSFQEVIFLNGANDFLSLTYSKEKKWNYYDEVINYKKQYAFHFEKKHQLKSIYYAQRIKNIILGFLEKHFKEKKLTVYQPNQHHLVNIFQEEYDTYEPNSPSLETVENYIFNLRLKKSMCIEFNLKCKFFLQPFLSSKNPLHIVEQETLDKIPFKDFKNTQLSWYEIAAAEIKKIPETDNIKFFDITDIFQNENELIYYDLGHYNDFANKLIADKIYESFNEK